MKLNKFALTLTAVALLPTFAFAGTDAVVASFERDLYREPVMVAAAFTGETDSLAELFDTALNGTTDQVIVSFERDLYREPANFAIAVAGENDSLVDMFNIALSGEASKSVKQAALGGKLIRGS